MSLASVILVTALAAGPATAPPSSQQVSDRAVAAQKAGDWRTAADLALEDLTKCRQDHPITDCLILYHQAGRNLWVSGRTAEGERTIREGMAVAQRQAKPGDLLDILQIGLVDILVDQRRFVEAAPYADRTLASMMRVLGPDDPNTVNLRTQRATIAAEMGENQRAQKLLEQLDQTLTNWPASLDRDRRRVAILGRQVDQLLRLDRPVEAEAKARQALALEEAIGSLGETEAAISLNAVGAALIAQQRAEEAPPYLERALKIDQAHAVTGDTPEAHASISRVALRMQNIAAAYGMLGAYDRSAPRYRYVVDAVEQKVFAMPPAQEATLRANYAHTLSELGDWRGATAQYRRAREIRLALHGPNHPDVAETATLLAGLLTSNGQPAQAEALYREAIPVLERARGPASLSVSAARAGLAEVYLHGLGRPQSALAQYRLAFPTGIASGGDEAFARHVGEARRADFARYVEACWIAGQAPKR